MEPTILQSGRGKRIRLPASLVITHVLLIVSICATMVMTMPTLGN